MTAHAIDEETVRGRFELIEVDDEGVLLNRESGAFYRLNRTAYQIWAGVLAGRSIATVVDELVRHFGLERAQAGRDTLAALEEFPPPMTVPPADRFRWGILASGYGFYVDGSLVCEVGPRGDSLRLRQGAMPSVKEARVQLKSVVPKLLALRGIRVLHAAAVEIERSLLVFSGRSGAGKTTSARTFAEAGGRLISEDLLIFASDAGGGDAVVDAERTIRAWVTVEGERLAAHPDQPIDCTALDRCLDGERRPVRRILLIDAARRAGDRIATDDLSRPDALIALMENSYFASAEAGYWRSSFESLRALVKAVSTARAVMPQGLPELMTAARAFTTAG